MLLNQEEEEEMRRLMLHNKYRRAAIRDEPKTFIHDFRPKVSCCPGEWYGLIQPNSANFPRAFWRNAEFFRRLPDEKIMESIRKGISGTSMPLFGYLLGDELINSLIELIFKEFVRIQRDDKRKDLPLLLLRGRDGP